MYFKGRSRSCWPSDPEPSVKTLIHFAEAASWNKLQAMRCNSNLHNGTLVPRLTRASKTDNGYVSHLLFANVLELTVRNTVLADEIAKAK
jgi:hypothetical protein